MAEFRKRPLILEYLRTKKPPAVLAVYVWRFAVTSAVRPVQSSFLIGRLTVRTIIPVVPILGLSSGDWPRLACERARCGYAEDRLGAT